MAAIRQPLAPQDSHSFRTRTGFQSSAVFVFLFHGIPLDYHIDFLVWVYTGWCWVHVVPQQNRTPPACSGIMRSLQAGGDGPHRRKTK